MLTHASHWYQTPHVTFNEQFFLSTSPYATFGIFEYGWHRKLHKKLMSTLPYRRKIFFSLLKHFQCKAKKKGSHWEFLCVGMFRKLIISVLNISLRPAQVGWIFQMGTTGSTNEGHILRWPYTPFHVILEKILIFLFSKLLQVDTQNQPSRKRFTKKKLGNKQLLIVYFLVISKNF